MKPLLAAILPMYLLCYLALPLIGCSKKPKSVPPPAPPIEKDYGSQTQLADVGVGQGKTLEEMGFDKSLRWYMPVFFEFNRATIRKEQIGNLHHIVDWMQAKGYTACILEGHACPIGDTEYNQALSSARAHAVRLYLVAAGLNMPFDVLGYGEERPYTLDPSEFWKNRRVEVICE